MFSVCSKVFFMNFNKIIFNNYFNFIDDNKQLRQIFIFINIKAEINKAIEIFQVLFLKSFR